MELIPKVKPDGTAVFYARCATHNWFYKGLPPLTHGCPECWNVYYFMTGARKPESFKDYVDETEAVILHATENLDELENIIWLKHPEIKIEKES